MEYAIHAAGAQAMNSPRAIAIMFDKVACHAIFHAAGVPTPEVLQPTAIHSYDELTATMNARGWRRVFVKLAHGSSASGVVAYQRGERQRAATTSAELVRQDGQVKLYNSLKVRRYTEERDIAAIVDALCRERVHVERWLPKASLARGVFDLRVVVIAGRPRHVVVRHGRSPMTNLHLGNARGSFEEFLQTAGERVWAEVAESCRQAVASFERDASPREVHYAGIDVCLTPGFRRHAVLEINAFGDLLPGMRHEGQDTYEAEIAELICERA
jgi:glutathione synthase/RimK-type ligase-like ATP-grasp enzyme